MKKTYLYLIILLLLTATAYFLLNKDSGTIPESEKEFAVKDIENISKILLAGKDERKIVLEKTAYGWSVNNEYLARQDGIDNLLKTIRDVRADYPVPKNQKNSVVKQLATSATKVEIYDTKLKRIKTYYVGDATNQYKGTYMILEDAENPFVTSIPGFQGFLSTRYFLDLEEWKDRIIFRYQPEHIKNISIEYPQNPTSGFTLCVITPDTFSISKSEKPNETIKYNTEKVKLFISFFQRAGAEAYNNANSLKDSILQTTPFCIISVQDTTDYVNEIKFYHKPLDKRTKQQFDEQGNPMPYDMDRYFASVNKGKDFMLVQDFVFGKFFRTWKDFEK